MSRARAMNLLDVPVSGALGGGAEVSYLLDTYSATLALSTRQLRTGQTAALRLRRDSDNAEMDFGFSGGELDVAAIATWLGGANGFGTVWYDQSGNSNDATRPVASDQPAYAVSGINNLPALHFDTTDDYMSITELDIDGEFNIFNVMNGQESFSGAYGKSVTDLLRVNWGNSVDVEVNNAQLQLSNSGVNSQGEDSLYLWYRDSGNDLHIEQDGVDISIAPLVNNTAQLEISLIGNYATAWEAMHSEQIFVNGTLSGAARAAISADMKAYWID